MARTTPMLAILSLWIGSGLGCASKNGSGDTGDEAASDAADGGDDATSGTLEIRFEMDPDLITAMDEPAAGLFQGQIYDAEEVTALGPEDDATILDAFEVNLDMGDGQTSTGIVHTTVQLDVPYAVVLGFLDSDGNATASENEPDGGDPVTLPGPNTFEVVFGQSMAVTVDFGLLYPGG
jgi:hypothetical protein